MSTIKKYKKHKYAHYKLYVPENLNIDELLRLHPPSFEGIPRKYNNYRDKLIYILHLINAIPEEKNGFDYEESLGFTPINKIFLRNRIHDYRHYIDYLKERDIIIEGTSYKVGEYSKGLKFAEKYQTKVKVVTITTGSLIKSIVTANHNRDVEAEKKLFFLKEWFNEDLKVDLDGSVKYLESDGLKAARKAMRKRKQKKYTESKLKSLMSIEEIVQKGFISNHGTVLRIYEQDYKHRLKIDLTTGRFHSPLTRLKKELRQFLTYDGESLVNIDITNSQPFLTLIILDEMILTNMSIKDLIIKYNPAFKDVKVNNKYKTSRSYTMLVNLIRKGAHKKDVIQFKKSIIEGSYYEYFSDILLKRNLIPADIIDISDESSRKGEIRGFAKEATFHALFGRVGYIRNRPFVRSFKDCFPNVFKVFQLVKSGRRPKNKSGRLSKNKDLGTESAHNTLACILQGFESFLVLHKTCTEIHAFNPEIPIFTIHDSIVTLDKYSQIVTQIFSKNIYEVLGVTPKLSVEQW